LNDLIYGSPYSRIEAAFALSAIQGLVLDFGFKYYLPSDEGTTSWGEVRTDYTRGMVIGLGAKYTGGGFHGFGKGAYAIEGRIDAALGGKYQSTTNYGQLVTTDMETGLNLNVHLSPSYNLGICTVGGDFGLETQADGTSGGADDKTGYTRFGAGAWIQKELGMAKYIKAGLGATLPYKDNADVEHGAIISIPVVFQYVFF
jgi:hypothetical protein